MRLAVLTLIATMLIAAFALTYANSTSTNAGLPLVHAALPKHGFICVPTITPRIRPVRMKEWV